MGRLSNLAVFLDTGFLIAVKNSDDKHHKTAIKEMRELLQGKLGKIFTSDYILDELLTLARNKLKSKVKVQEIADFILLSPRISVLALAPNDFTQALDFFWKHFENGLSFTDCTILVQCSSLEVENVATFDSHFHGLLGVIPQ